MSDPLPGPAVGGLSREARECPELHTTTSDPALVFHQVTTDVAHDAHGPVGALAHHFFTPDSRRFIFVRERGAGREGTPATEKGSEFVLCELADGLALRRLTDEPRVSAGVLHPSGRWFYYFLDHSHLPDHPHLVLKRVDLQDFRREVVLVVDGPVPGVGRVPRGGHMYGWASMRNDGEAICASASFYTETDPLFATLVFDLRRGTVAGFEFEPYNWRPIGIYYRGQDPQYPDHLLVCKSHWRSGTGVDGKWYAERYDDVDRPTLHVWTDTGRQVATVPIGDVGEGVDHPCWRGERYEVVTHTSSFKTAPHWRGIMLAAAPLVCAEADQYRGAKIPGAHRVELTRHLRRPDLCHHSWEPSGTHVVCDTEGWHNNGLASYLWLGTVREDAADGPCLVPRYLVHPQSSWTGSYWTQCQPALSPDGRTVFFNSDYLGPSGHPQVFCVQGFTFP